MVMNSCRIFINKRTDDKNNVADAPYIATVNLAASIVLLRTAHGESKMPARMTTQNEEVFCKNRTAISIDICCVSAAVELSGSNVPIMARICIVSS